MIKKIEVSALISLENIKIIASAKRDNNVFLIHEEKILLPKGTNIFNINNEKKSLVKKSIKNSLNNIRKKITSNIKKINIVFDDFNGNSKYWNFETKILEETVTYNNPKFVNQDDCNKIVRLVVNKSLKTDNDKEFISIVPFRFIYLESDKSFEQETNHFPVGKKIKKIRIIFSTRYMNKENYLSSIKYFDLSSLKIKSIILETQLMIYNSNTQENNLNKINYTLAIKNNKSILISSVNDVVIKTNTLNYSFKDLVKKLSENFRISNQEAKNLINCYGNLNNDINLNEIIYSSYSIDSKYLKSIKKQDIIEIIKSFLKSTCQQANSIIEDINKNTKNFSYEIKIVGEITTIEGMQNYCSKYFNNAKISLNENEKSIYSWNASFESIKNYWSYIQILANKLNPETFYYNNREYNRLNREDAKNDSRLNNIVNENAVKALLI